MSEWKKCSLKSTVTYISRGKSPKYAELSRYKVVNQKCIYWNKFKEENVKYLTEEAGDNYTEERFIRPGDILLNSTGTGTIGRALVFDKDTEEYVADSHVTVIRTNPSILDSRYLVEYIASARGQKQLESECYSGSTNQVELNKSKFEQLTLTLPPLKEQQKIAEILSSVDEAIEKTEAIIKQTETVKKGLMQQLLTKGIGHTEFKQTDIGEVPQEWNLIPLGELGRVVTGNTPKTSDKENYGNDYLWVSPADMGKNKYIRKTNKMLSLKGFNQTRKLPKGAILVTCIGTIGKIGIASTNLSTNQQINSIICDKETSNYEYVYYTLIHNFKNYNSHISHQVVPIINKTTFSRFLIALPTLKEQEKIARILSQVDAKDSKEKERLNQLYLLKKSLMQTLLTGKIRVNVDQPEVLI